MAENWKKWKRQFENYLMGMECNDKADPIKVAIFLNLIGDESLEVFESLNVTEDERAVYQTVLTKMEAFCKPKNNVVYERHKFYQKFQKDGEPFDTFLMEIRHLIRTCEFGETENEMLRDRIVMGMADKRVQARLLGTTDLTYDKAVERCRAEELTQEQAKKMSKAVLSKSKQ